MRRHEDDLIFRRAAKASIQLAAAIQNFSHALRARLFKEGIQKIMRIKMSGALAALAICAAGSALAQAPAAPPAPVAAPSVDKTPIGVLWANPTTQAILKKDLPELEAFVDQLKDMTLADAAPRSQGVLDDAKLKKIQADFDSAGK